MTVTTVMIGETDMPEFQYIAIGKNGSKIRGVQTGSSARDVVSRLREKGMVPLRIKEHRQSVWKRPLTIVRKVKLRQFAVFCRQLATMVDAGIPLLESVSALASQAETRRFQQVLNEILNDISSGELLSSAFQRHPRVFSPLTVSLVQAGEQSGTLAEVLLRVADHEERLYESRGRIRAALTYPAILTVVAVGVAVFLLTSIVPEFARMFAALRAPLPVPTQIVLFLSAALANHWLVIVVGIIAAAGAFYGMIRSARGRRTLDAVVLKLPVLGDFVLKSSIARVARTLSMLLSSAVGLVDALTMAANTVSNQRLRDLMVQSRQSVELGEPLSAAFQRPGLLPPMMMQMIAVGEQTGTLDAMLLRLADYYDSEVSVQATQLKGFVEPVFILVAAGIVGIIVSSIILPMFTILQYV